MISNCHHAAVVAVAVAVQARLVAAAALIKMFKDWFVPVLKLKTPATTILFK
jgi:hypothetical protein